MYISRTVLKLRIKESIYFDFFTNIVLEKVSCKGWSFDAKPNMEIIVVRIVALIKNCPIFGRLPFVEITLVPVIILAGVCKKIHSNKKV